MGACGPSGTGAPGLAVSRQADPPGLRLAGDIDEDTRPALAAELELLAGTATVHLYLGAVTYCDLAGLRLLLRLTGPAACDDAEPAGPARRDTGPTVVLHDVPPWLHRIVTIIGWESSPGVCISGPGT